MTCSICGATEATPCFSARDYLTGETFQIVQCQTCMMHFVSPQPALEEMSRYYPPVYYGDRRSFFEVVTCWIRMRHVQRAQGHHKTGTLLDVGCGKGGMLQMLQKKGWRVLGTEFGTHPAQTTGDGDAVDIRYGALEACQLPGDSFDVVTLWHVLEHLTNPRETLREIRRLLKKEGKIILAVPNFGSLQAQWAGRHWLHLDVPRHVWHFTQVHLTSLLEQEGFAIEKRRAFSFEYDTFGFVQSFLNWLLPRQNLLFDLLQQRGALQNPAQPEKALHKGDIFGGVVSVLLAPWLFLLALLFCLMESTLGYGGTIEVVAQKVEG